MDKDSNQKNEIKKITSRAENYSEWYLDIVEVAGLAEHGPSKGSMVIKPYGYAIWESIQKYLDKKFKETGVENAYFPMLIPERLMHKEQSHVEGFAPEVAVVTHAGGQKLEEPLIVRPTSETIMYDVFSRWIKSYRDLPLLINQWTNVVRWEMRPRLFLRTTEFLWQEGHTVHATFKEADDRARQMLDIYADFAENVAMIPVIKGMKTDSERFAGALHTYCLEAMMQDGKALQFATSHNLGQNFAKVFEIEFLTNEQTKDFAWQTSWGLSTRTIGGIIMTHSDDKGLVLPSGLASIQAVIISIFKDVETTEAVKQMSVDVFDRLRNAGIKTKLDDREVRPGEKHYEWEKKGVPIRIEIGPRDVAEKNVVLVRRDTGEKSTVSIVDLETAVQNMLKSLDKNLYDRALAYKKEKIKTVDTWEDFVKEIEAGNFVLAHWSGSAEVEAKIKEETKATIRCIPFDAVEEDGSCIYSKQPSKKRVVFARAY